MSTEASTSAPVRSLKRGRIPVVAGFTLLGRDVGWYGIAGIAALLSGPVLYSAFRAIYGGPGMEDAA